MVEAHSIAESARDSVDTAVGEATVADAKAKFVGANSRAAAALYHTGVVAEASMGNATTTCTQAAKVTAEAE